MDCDPNDAACLLQVLIEQGQQGPSTLEIFSSIVVPLLLGVATVILGIASWRIAQQSHRLNVRLSEVSESESQLAKRKEIAQGLVGWAEYQWAATDKDRDALKQHVIELDRLQVTASLEKTPRLSLLLRDLRRLAEVPTKDEHPQRFGYKIGMLSGFARAMIQVWLSAPELYTDIWDSLPDLTENLDEKARERYPDEWVSKKE